MISHVPFEGLPDDPVRKEREHENCRETLNISRRLLPRISYAGVPAGRNRRKNECQPEVRDTVNAKSQHHNCSSEQRDLVVKVSLPVAKDDVRYADENYE